jgi:hypothetical protein
VESNSSRSTDENGSSQKKLEQQRPNEFAMARSKNTTRKPAHNEFIPQRGKRPVDVGRLLEPLPERSRALLALGACEVHQVETGEPGVYHVVRDVLQERSKSKKSSTFHQDVNVRLEKPVAKEEVHDECRKELLAHTTEATRMVRE